MIQRQFYLMNQVRFCITITQTNNLSKKINSSLHIILDYMIAINIFIYVIYQKASEYL